MTETSPEDLEAFAESLTGPMGRLLRQAGVIMARRMERRGATWSDLSDTEVVALFHSAFLTVAPAVYGRLDRATVEDHVNALFADITMQLSATAEGSTSRH